MRPTPRQQPPTVPLLHCVAASPEACTGRDVALENLSGLGLGWAELASKPRPSWAELQDHLNPHFFVPQVFLTSPTEVAKVRLQMQTQPQPQRRPSAPWLSAAPPACPIPYTGPGLEPKYHGPLHCLATVAREEGLRGLYKGSSALLLRDGHSFATYFLSYAILCEWLTATGHSQPGLRGLGCAGEGLGHLQGRPRWSHTQGPVWDWTLSVTRNQGQGVTLD